MNIEKQETKASLMQLLFLTAGSVIFAVGIHFFRVPNSFVVGGASGLSIISYQITFIIVYVICAGLSPYLSYTCGV